MMEIFLLFFDDGEKTPKIQTLKIKRQNYQPVFEKNMIIRIMIESDLVIYPQIDTIIYTYLITCYKRLRMTC